jgi:hypothetical protein
MKRIAILALFIAASGQAAEWVAGADGDNRHTFAYLMRVQRKPLSRGAELVFSENVSYLHYDASDVTVNSPGIGAAVQYRVFGPRFTVSAGPGYEVRYTTRRENGASTSKIEQGPLALGNATVLVAQRTWLGADGSYSAANRWLASRAQVKQGVSDTLRVGAEIGWSGNDDLRIRSQGGLIEVPPGLQFRAGTSTIRDRNGTETREPYYSVGIARSF